MLRALNPLKLTNQQFNQLTYGESSDNFGGGDKQQDEYGYTQGAA